MRRRQLGLDQRERRDEAVLVEVVVRDRGGVDPAARVVEVGEGDLGGKAIRLDR
jgi:hypothetical protein